MSDLNKDRCPKCFTKYSENKWTQDPVLTNNGSKFIYDNVSGLLIPQSDITKRLYKGFYQIKSQIIKELQENRQQAENDAGILPANQTIFSKTEDDANGFWLINMKHIKELRESTEKILTATGQTKEEYFNYDEGQVERQTPHQMDWIDPILNNWIGVLNDRHIEDLRKALIYSLIERYTITPPETYWSNSLVESETVPNQYNASGTQIITIKDTGTRAISSIYNMMEVDYTGEGMISYVAQEWRWVQVPFPYYTAVVVSGFSVEAKTQGDFGGNVTGFSNHNVQTQATASLIVTGNSITLPSDEVPPSPPSEDTWWTYSFSGTNNWVLDLLYYTKHTFTIIQGLTISPKLHLSIDITNTPVYSSPIIESGFIKINFGIASTWTLPLNSLSSMNIYNEYISRTGNPPSISEKIIGINIEQYIIGTVTGIITVNGRTKNISGGDLTFSSNLIHDNIVFEYKNI